MCNALGKGMIRSIMPLSLLMLALPSAALAGDASAVFGDWRTEDGGAVLRLAPCSETDPAPCGTILSADIPDGAPTTDVNNADPSLRDQPIIGLTMLDGFEASGDKWKGGRIYNPEDGKSYKSSLEVRDDAPDVLRVKGCIAFLCQTQKWTRVG